MKNSRLCLLILVLVLGTARASAASSAAWVERGLDEKFIAEALREYGQMGFKNIVTIYDIDNALKDSDLSKEAGTTRSALFSMSRKASVGQKCIIAMSAMALPGAPERRLAQSTEGFGATKAKAWQAMFRHELGHCALNELSQSEQRPDVFVAEPFADVFALSWGLAKEGESYLITADAYAEARRRVSGGAHQTSRDIQRWRALSHSISPCAQAWKIAPLDGRDPESACPRGSGLAGKIKSWFGQ